jgi:hypothetical protein
MDSWKMSYELYLLNRGFNPSAYMRAWLGFARMLRRDDQSSYLDLRFPSGQHDIICGLTFTNVEPIFSQSNEGFDPIDIIKINSVKSPNEKIKINALEGRLITRGDYYKIKDYDPEDIPIPSQNIIQPKYYDFVLRQRML